ncbi:unnamed protein product [Vitrella brassicaformis CCMP3155]|uniref:DNA polymerase n=1 Tax=Vitrella brassicaformis (strain CCMP3155) TaxID=1169540 RepID=A0A0G4F3E4_VITBC|nr:unnamed protein product [Vitrella brassicaformis CCMP3155]|eukprot:CEM06350.1 unnamed protein product [Vitrella brassicaformis CCMP3155]
MGKDKVSDSLVALKRARAGNEKRTEQQTDADDVAPLYEEVDDEEYRRRRAVGDFVEFEGGETHGYGDDDDIEYDDWEAERKHEEQLDERERRKASKRDHGRVGVGNKGGHHRRKDPAADAKGMQKISTHFARMAASAPAHKPANLPKTGRSAAAEREVQAEMERLEKDAAPDAPAPTHPHSSSGMLDSASHHSAGFQQQFAAAMMGMGMGGGMGGLGMGVPGIGSIGGLMGLSTLMGMGAMHGGAGGLMPGGNPLQINMGTSGVPTAVNRTPGYQSPMAAPAPEEGIKGDQQQQDRDGDGGRFDNDVDMADAAGGQDGGHDGGDGGYGAPPGPPDVDMEPPQPPAAPREPAPSMPMSGLEVFDEPAVPQPSSNGRPASGSGDAAAGDRDPLPVCDDGTLPFYILDAHEEDRTGTVYLFGKVWERAAKGSSARQPLVPPRSCCVVVRKISRNLFVRAGEQPDEEGEVQQVCGEVYREFKELRERAGIKNFKCKPVRRNYAFEREGMTRGDQQLFLKVQYSADQPMLKADATGEHFTHIFGTTTSLVETLIVKRRIYGPCWLKVSDFTQVTEGMQSWCEYEVSIDGHKGIRRWQERNAVTKTAAATNGEDDDGNDSPSAKERRVDEGDGPEPPHPPLTVMSLAIKTAQNKHKQNEILMMTYHCRFHCDIDRVDGFNGRNRRNWAALRKVDVATPLPDGSSVLFQQRGIGTTRDEHGLLSQFIAKLHADDPDIIVGHRLLAYALGVLHNSLSASSLGKSAAWTKLSRLRARPMRDLKSFRRWGGPVNVARNLTIGRLMVDTENSAKEHLLSRVNYELSTLVSELLPGKSFQEYPKEKLSVCYDSVHGLTDAVNHTHTEATLAFEIMVKLELLQLSRQLTTLAGNLWWRTLQSQRAERVEYLLLHEFHEKKYVCPDKKDFKAKDKKTAASAKKKGKGKKGKGKQNQNQQQQQQQHDGDGDMAMYEDMVDEMLAGADEGAGGDEDEPGDAGGGGGAGERPHASAKGPQYAGGLVLEPQVGMYDNFILALDFNSLYPSIIQEFNICFTTVDRPDEAHLDADFEADPPIAAEAGILPEILRRLVQTRRAVKQAMGREKDKAKRATLDVRQKALKLTANAMYGCLGFRNARFFCQPIAALITKRGREILQSTKMLAESKLRMDVIYGDTDSIMINSQVADDGRLESFEKALKMGHELRAVVNRQYSKLEIDIDGIFTRMLLLRKKKYACIKVKDYANQKFEREMKGIELVRRDWCPLVKDLGEKILDRILSRDPKDDVVEWIHDFLREASNKMDNDQYPLSVYVITKNLAKNVRDYAADAKGQPHVIVARRMQARGESIGQHSSIPYVICTAPVPQPVADEADGDGQADGQQRQQQGDGNGGGQPSGGAVSWSERAAHPAEVKTHGLKVDIAYYKSQQVHGPISRICAPVEGTDAGMLAECLGLDKSKYSIHVRGDGGDGGDEVDPLASPFDALQKEDDNFDGVDLGKIRCPFTGKDCPAADVLKSAELRHSVSGKVMPVQYLLNWIMLAVRHWTKLYTYHGRKCAECKADTIRVCLSSERKCPQWGCGRVDGMHSDFTNQHLHKRLLHVEYLVREGKKHADLILPPPPPTPTGDKKKDKDTEEKQKKRWQHRLALYRKVQRLLGQDALDVIESIGRAAYGCHASIADDALFPPEEGPSLSPDLMEGRLAPVFNP